jgi:hypothetical protein
VTSGDGVVERDGRCLGVLIVGKLRRGGNELRARVDFGRLDVQVDCVQRDGCSVLDDVEPMCILGPKHRPEAND